jgi:pyridoxal phosphate enzyme (YggS family)
MIDVGANLAAVRARIVGAAQRVGRDPAAVRLIAVSKTKSAELVSAALAAGVTDIGENYVQEAAAKRASVHGVARWHLIGPLQRNKVAKALETFDCIQSVDRAALAETLARHAAQRTSPLPILVEVNIGGEASKHGVAPSDLPALLAALRDPHLAVCGLMTVPPPADATATRRYFHQLRELAETHGLPELSMGMTDDFEIAIEEGATMVRVGRAIFGARSATT